jgi:hypothetical protein
MNCTWLLHTHRDTLANVNGRGVLTLRWLYWLQIALLTFIAVAVFQVFLRYQYIAGNGTTWRIDRVTHQACEIERHRAVCKLPEPPPADPSPGHGIVALAK